ncbi:DUF4864 domain-containing protein [Roseibium sp. SCPC15]|uniref:DUF4864 domain-containing protein n=1 Tax=Roseibium sp. SCP15 TaxID=3141376 RepID=UPI003336C218
MAWTRFGKLLFTASLAGFLSTGLAKAGDNLDSDAFQSVIKNQMSAFASGNAERAFSYATKSLQQRFQNPEIFMQMVRQGYQPVYRPKMVTFGTAKVTSYGPTQEVFVTGPKGKNWLALYSFEQQADGSWRISGCYLRKFDGISA